jgi:hypothetical protein
MTLVEHARRELERCGQFTEDPAYAQALVAAVAAFSSYGHSGGSGGMAIMQLGELLQRHTLSPLTDDPDEWMHVANAESEPPHGLWQSTRDPAAFSPDLGRTYFRVDGWPRRNDPQPTVHAPRKPADEDVVNAVACTSDVDDARAAGESQ